MSWQVEVTPAVRKRIARISNPDKRRILKAIDDLHDGLAGDFAPLKGTSGFRIRVEGWRIILSVYKESRLILVRAVDTRGDVYKH